MMDLPCIQWQDYVAQKWTVLDPELKEKFTTLLEIDDVFKCSLTLTTQEDLDFVQSISAAYSVQKEAQQAAKCRERETPASRSETSLQLLCTIHRAYVLIL
ncbi:SET and MYND domain containing protein 4 [Dissostichus eleginoides]|uniref:SET and MYND domain containing protein 4 n=1 Tax=Dissostichus eleginoides TaxID=100907 RepID=A0AAD9BEF7_DISEL|nr:SET and MYND domain containing protein 4 [Dissostichus eleginoides]